MRLRWLIGLALALAAGTSGVHAQGPFRNQDWNGDGRIDSDDTRIVQRYRSYDINRDQRIGRNEWTGDRRLFLRLDTNRDGYVTLLEYARGGGYNLDALGGPAFRFFDIDVNRDGWITRREWNLSDADFNRLDVNRDSRISRFEFENAAMQPTTTRNAAWRTGYDRGIQEGMVAGREDAVRRQRWDLEGQRELQRADSGYAREIGRLRDYQAGYREGFRNAYRAGFIEGGGRPPR